MTVSGAGGSLPQRGKPHGVLNSVCVCAVFDKPSGLLEGFRKSHSYLGGQSGFAVVHVENNTVKNEWLHI